MKVWGALPSCASLFTGVQPNWNIFAADVAVTRRLYHSGLGIVCDYPVLPTKTTNFSWDVLLGRDIATQKSLTATLVSLWPGHPEDVIFREVWEAPGGLAFPWAFLHTLYQMWHAAPNWREGEYLVWRPFDRTHKVFPVDLVRVMVNGEELDAAWTGRPYSRAWTKEGTDPGRNVMSASTLEIHLKLRADVVPGAAVHLLEGSTTVEAI